MLKQLFTAAGFLGLTIAPALAIAPECGAQLNSIDGMLKQYPDKAASVKDRRDKAQELCAQGKDMEAQALLRQVREEIGGTSGSGTSTAGGTQAPRK